MTYSTYLSTSVKCRFDVNVRSNIAYREIGRGLTHIETFNRVMNMPPSYSHSNYDETVKELLGPYEDALNESMLEAAANVKSQATTVTQEQDEEVTESEDNQTLVHESSANVYDCDVSVDGSWQRRGYASLNSIVSAMEWVSDKVVDIDVVTKDCRSC